SPVATCVPADFSFGAPFLPFAALASARAASLGFLLPASDIDDLTGLLRETHETSVVQFAPADLRRAAVLGIVVRDVRQIDRSLLADDAALLALRLLRMALDHVHARDQSAVLRREHLDDLALAALVAARCDDHAVALLHLRGHQSTSGASEMIFIWFL